MYKLGFIGAGNIATALINGAVGGGTAAEEICVFDIDGVKVAEFASKGFATASSEAETAEHSKITFLTIKPAHLRTVLEAIKNSVDENSVLVSVVAGVSTAFIQRTVGKDVKVVRVMPNTPALICSGATAISYSDNTDEETKKTVTAIFNGVGLTAQLGENQMNEVISLNGSSPAYVYMFIKALADGAVAQGIAPDTAKALAIQSVIGSAQLALHSDKSLDELIRQVCSPNGTTLKAVESLENDGFYGVVARAMLACTKRAEELEGEL